VGEVVIDALDPLPELPADRAERPAAAAIAR
jgi:hypothetical protein